MNKEKMLWNRDHTQAVRASKLRCITVYHGRHSELSQKTHSEIKGWFNSNEDFDFGWFDTTEEANTFAEALTAKIEE